MRPILAVLALVAVGLAGCASGPAEAPAQEAVNPADFQLAAGKGAIAGVLFDDRYRPIELRDEAVSEFQAEGFILLQETGQKAVSNANGEFTFVDLTPGTYTLRLSVEGHEAAPKKILVEQGLFAEASVLARRIASDNSFIVSNEYAAFVPCGANIVFFGTSFDCTFDQSGDSERVSFIFDYSRLNATHMVMEMYSQKPDYYDIWLQSPGNQVCSGTYQILGGPETDYLRFQLNLNESAISSETASGAGCETQVWLNDEPLETIVYLNSIGFDQGIGFGAGIYYGLQANFVQNAFIGQVPEDIDTWCAYCS